MDARDEQTEATLHRAHVNKSEFNCSTPEEGSTVTKTLRP